jgi:hypothetical protein
MPANFVKSFKFIDLRIESQQIFEGSNPIATTSLYFKDSNKKIPMLEPTFINFI